MTYRVDARNEEIPDEVEDEKPETDEDPDDEITHPDWYYAEDWDKDFPNPRAYPDTRNEVNEFFKRNERLQDRFNEKEIESFLKLLDVKPNSDWTDKSGYHHATGVHTYVDEAQ